MEGRGGENVRNVEGPWLFGEGQAVLWKKGCGLAVLVGPQGTVGLSGSWGEMESSSEFFPVKHFREGMDC